jgi:hypothetical protein
VPEPARQQSFRRHCNGLDLIFLIARLPLFVNSLISLNGRTQPLRNIGDGMEFKS